jgi:hypothetical protein
MRFRLADEFNFLGQKINPDAGFDAVFQLLEALINFSMFVVGALSVIFIVIGALQMITATGNPQKIAASKKTMGMAVGGLLLSMSALVIVQFVKTIFK